MDVPSAQQAYVGRLDGCIDFQAAEALRRTFSPGWCPEESWTEEMLERFLSRHNASFPADFLRPTCIDSHDMDRFLYIAGGDKEALQRAAAAQMRLPGPPIIYYGTEVGMSQTKSTDEGGFEVSREPMIWGAEQDQELLAYYRELIGDRRNR